MNWAIGVVVVGSLLIVAFGLAALEEKLDRLIATLEQGPRERDRLREAVREIRTFAEPARTITPNARLLIIRDICRAAEQEEPK